MATTDDVIEQVAKRFRVKRSTARKWASHGAPIHPENLDFTRIEAWLSRLGESQNVSAAHYLTMGSSPDPSSSGKGDARGEDVVYISPSAYLKSILAIAWCCFRRPFSDTEIDLTTGEVVKAR